MNESEIYSAMQMDAITLSVTPKLVAEKQKRTEAYFIGLMQCIKKRATLGYRDAYLNCATEFEHINSEFIINELKKLGYTLSDHTPIFGEYTKDGLIRW